YDIDFERVLLPKHALTWSPSKLPPLFYRHIADVIGTVDELAYDDKGLRVSVTTDHAQAKCCGAFSIAATIREYELRDTDTAQFHAVIKSAVLDEVTLTPVPANPHALVMHRTPTCAQAEYYATMARMAAVVRKLTMGFYAPCSR